MNQFIFKSRWIAVAFTMLTLFSAYMLVGDEDDGSVLGNMQGAVIDQRDATAEQLAALANPEASEEGAVMMDDAEFVDDEELIDAASGSDPSPGGDEDYGDDAGGDGPQFGGGDGDFDDSEDYDSSGE